MTAPRRYRPLPIAVLLCAGAVLGAPHGPATTRVELQRWLAELQTARVANVASPLEWQYAFAAADGRALEALSLRLVRDGYRIVELRTAAGAARLRVARTELHTAATLERRNSDLQAAAREHGVSYEGVDLPLHR